MGEASQSAQVGSATNSAVTSKLVVPQLKIRKKGTDLVREDGAKVVTVKNEYTGKQGGTLVHHKSGRVDAHVTPDPVRPGFDALNMKMSEFQRTMYEKLRARGLSHEEALLLTPAPTPPSLRG